MRIETIKKVAKFSLNKQSGLLGINRESIIVHRGTRKASRTIPLIDRVTGYLVKHFEEGNCIEKSHFYTDLELSIVKHCKHILDSYKPGGRFEDNLKEDEINKNEFYHIKTCMIGSCRWMHEIENQKDIYKRKAQKKIKPEYWEILSLLKYRIQYRGSLVNYFAHVKVIRNSKDNYIIVRNSNKFSVEQLVMIQLMQNLPNSVVSLLRVEEKKVEETTFISQESILLFEKIKDDYPSLITELNDKKYHLSIFGWAGKFDALIPELKLFIEYDGSYWHKESIEKDLQKVMVAESEGFRVLRIRQSPLKLISKNDVAVPKKFDVETYSKIVLGKIAELNNPF